MSSSHLLRLSTTSICTVYRYVYALLASSSYRSPVGTCRVCVGSKVRVDTHITCLSMSIAISPIHFDLQVHALGCGTKSSFSADKLVSPRMPANSRTTGMSWQKERARALTTAETQELQHPAHPITLRSLRLQLACLSSSLASLLYV